MFKDLFTFKEGFWLGILAWFFAIIFIALIAGMITDSIEMEKEHCVQTEQTREVNYTYSILVGKVIVPQQGITTERLYTCDDKPRWR